MGTIADKLSKLTATKNAIKAALTGKGVTVSDNDTFASYADKIGEISGINPNWTNWGCFSYYDNRNDLVSKLKYTDTSNGTSFSYMFNYCDSLTAIPALDTSNGTSFSGMFIGCRSLITIPEINTTKSNGFGNMFDNCNSLVDLTLTGLLKQSGMNLRYSTKLSKASITSVINALDASVSGKSVTLSLTAVNAAFETAAGANDGSASAEWQNLIAAKPNWTISLS